MLCRLITVSQSAVYALCVVFVSVRMDTFCVCIIDKVGNGKHTLVPLLAEKG